MAKYGREFFYQLGKYAAYQDNFRADRMSSALLFVYGTLRPGFDGPIARWLRSVAIVMGPARVNGVLYRVGHYPGFVPGDAGAVTGDLFALTDPAAILARLDDYEECAAHFPEPHEYRRAVVTVEARDGPVVAWTYIYARDVTGLERIADGDFQDRDFQG